MFTHDRCVSCSDINFAINFFDQPGDEVECRGPANFDEGVELAVSNPDSAGEWIPLYYTAPASSRANPEHDIHIDLISSTAVNLRGYNTSYTVSRLHAASVSLCGQHVKDGIQLRWLQTTSFTSRPPPDDSANLRDRWTLDGVTVTLHTDETNSVSLLEEESEEQILPTIRTDRCDDLYTITLVVNHYGCQYCMEWFSPLGGSHIAHNNVKCFLLTYSLSVL